MSKRNMIYYPALAFGAASLASMAVNYILYKELYNEDFHASHRQNENDHNSNDKVEAPKVNVLKPRKSSVKISRYLYKLLNTLGNERLLFIEIKAKNRSSREIVLKQLEALKTDEPVDEMWIADFYKQSYSRGDTIALANRKAIFYLSSLEEIQKVRISARTTVAKLVGNSLSKLSIKYPSLEKYLFEPMLDIYAPLKETEELSNFGNIDDNKVYRGGMPVGDQNYEYLKKMGIKTVINLKIEDSAVEYVAEQNNLLKRDINLHYLPLPNVAPPSMLQAMEFLTIAYNTQMTPVFFHCHRGSDRTGVIAAIYRITQGYTASWALVEAEKYNIASSFFAKKIDFVYEFEKQWLKWKAEKKVPEDLTNFDFIKLMEEEEGLLEADDEANMEEENQDTEKS